MFLVKRYNVLIIFLLLLNMLIVGCGSPAVKENLDKSQKELPVSSSQLSEDNEEAKPADGKLAVHFIDVGQGDCILVRSPQGQDLLIDAGAREKGKKVTSYLQALGVKRLAAVVGTHPHSDHIGGLIEVIKQFPVDKLYLPAATHTSPTFEELLETIKSKQLKISIARAGVLLPLDGVEARFLAPLKDHYENLNNFSAVIKLSYGKNSFLFMGDAEKESEEQILKAGAEIKADVLKAGHHGSSSSSSAEFLQTVSPSYAVIMCGLDNDYGHPHQETVIALQNAGVVIYRTNQDGTILMKSDGQKIEIQSSGEIRSAGTPPSNIEETTPEMLPNSNAGLFIGNKNSKKFHLPTCKNLPELQNRVNFWNREDAIAQGYVPCKSCNP